MSVEPSTAGGLPVPAGFIALELGKGCVLVIPERIYRAGLALGKQLRRRDVLARRTDPVPDERSPDPPAV